MMNYCRLLFFLFSISLTFLLFRECLGKPSERNYHPLDDNPQSYQHENISKRSSDSRLASPIMFFIKPTRYQGSEPTHSSRSAENHEPSSGQIDHNFDIVSKNPTDGAAMDHEIPSTPKDDCQKLLDTVFEIINKNNSQDSQLGDQSPDVSTIFTGTEIPESLNDAHYPNHSECFQDSKQDYKDVCLTEGCIHAASKLMEFMDRDVEPCDDFYKFSCGNFLNNTVIPDDKTAVTSSSVLSEKLQEQLRMSIEEESRPDEPRHFRLVKNLFRNCMNKTAIEEKGLTPATENLKALGGWPVLEGDSWREEDFDWKESVYKFRKAGYSANYFIDFRVGIDLKNSTKRILDIDQVSPGLSREFLIKGFGDKIVDAYYSYMVDIAVILGANRTRAEEELKLSLEFEMKLANISLPAEKRRNGTALYNPMTVKELTGNYTTIPWKKYINNILNPYAEIDDDEIVIVNVPTYFKEFEKIMKETPKRTQANYVLWRAAAATISYLPDDIRRRQLKYSTVINGKTEREARWKECIDLASGSLSLSVGALYVRKYFDEESKKSAVEMVTDIRREFTKILKKVDWMDEKTRKSALEKAESMSTHIAYPDELLNDKKLEEFYQKLELTEGDYFQSILNLTLFGTEYAFSRLRKPVNKSDWISHGRPAIVNALYYPLENSIQFPAGILQGSFFSKDRPRYMNYGAIGFVIGHEITHGFDDQGRQFDKEGNLVEWWEPETREKYLTKAECIINQYGNYTAKDVGLNVNGINTQGENIADNGGIKESYLAYQEWVRKNSPEPMLPGLDYTPSQLFWMSAAHTKCSKYRSESLKVRITTGVHSPGEFRVRGSLSNMPEFAEDFNCPKGSRMNPVEKCSVW